ncbi:ribonuclease H-like domain-containing protein [Tanacetum coccineum]
MTHSSPKRNMVPKAVLMRSGLVSLTTTKPVNTAQPRTTVNNARAIHKCDLQDQGVIDSSAQATKDETSGILKSFITGVENLIDQRVKVIRCDNETEFKNKEMNQFCERKGIKREFSVARTPQQNGVADRKNRTLIEAARTMLADSNLPTTCWTEAVNTACYVQNKVLVTKPHNKTPYELFLGRKPALRFMRPFGCPITILNTIDHLRKFDGKADEGFFVGVNTPNITRSGPNWLFDIDALTKSMNYKPVVVGNQSNGNAGTKACDNAGKAIMETVPGKDYILLPLWPADLPLSQNLKSSPDAGFKPSGDNEKKITEEPGKEGGDPRNKNDSVNSTNNINTASDGNKTNNVNTVSSTVNTARIEVNDVSSNTSIELPNDPNMPELEDIYSAFARFNTIITSLKDLDEGYSSKNYVRKFLRALHPKWRAKVMEIKESKDLTSLSLDELIGNLNVHEMIIKKDSKIVKAKVERKSLALKANKESSDEECSTSGSKDEEYVMAVRDFKKFFKRRECPKPPKDKNQRAFVKGSWSDSGEEDDEKVKNETCLIAHAFK